MKRRSKWAKKEKLQLHSFMSCRYIRLDYRYRSVIRNKTNIEIKCNWNWKSFFESKEKKNRKVENDMIHQSVEFKYYAEVK